MGKSEYPGNDNRRIARRALLAARAAPAQDSATAVEIVDHQGPEALINIAIGNASA
jgi:hypothetical protein